MEKSFGFSADFLSGAGAGRLLCAPFRGRGGGKDFRWNTSASYRTWLGDSRSTRYNGRVWTDKTVYTGDAFFGGDLGAETVTNDAEFLTAWSALATSQEVLGKQPADVVFILDFSASMTWGVDSTEVSAPDGSDSRIRYMTDALNSAIQTLAEANPGNRVGIVTFNKVGATLLPLTELSPENLERVKNGQYLELTSFSGTPGGKAWITTREIPLDGEIMSRPGAPTDLCPC